MTKQDQFILSSFIGMLLFIITIFVGALTIQQYNYYGFIAMAAFLIPSAILLCYGMHIYNQLGTDETTEENKQC